MSCLMINDIDAGLGRFGKPISDLERRNINTCNFWYIPPLLFTTLCMCVLHLLVWLVFDQLSTECNVATFIQGILK